MDEKLHEMEGLYSRGPEKGQWTGLQMAKQLRDIIIYSIFIYLITYAYICSVVHVWVSNFLIEINW